MSSKPFPHDGLINSLAIGVAYGACRFRAIGGSPSPSTNRKVTSSILISRIITRSCPCVSPSPLTLAGSSGWKSSIRTALTVTDAAKALGVTRAALSALFNGRAALSAEMALRIEKAFGVGMDTLLRTQTSYEIAETRRKASRISSFFALRFRL